MRKNSFVIFFERLFFHTVYFSLRKKIKCNIHISALLMLQFRTFTILRIWYVRLQSTNIYYVAGTVLGAGKTELIRCDQLSLPVMWAANAPAVSKIRQIGVLPDNACQYEERVEGRKSRGSLTSDSHYGYPRMGSLGQKFTLLAL